MTWSEFAKRVTRVLLFGSCLGSGYCLKVSTCHRFSRPRVPIASGGHQLAPRKSGHKVASRLVVKRDHLMWSTLVPATLSHASTPRSHAHARARLNVSRFGQFLWGARSLPEEHSFNHRPCLDPPSTLMAGELGFWEPRNSIQAASREELGRRFGRELVQSQAGPRPTGPGLGFGV